METLAFNWNKIFLDTDRFQLRYLFTTDPQTISDYRDEYPDYIFLKYKDRTYYWGGDSLTDGQTQSICLNDEPYLTSRILEYSFLSKFYEKQDFYINKNYVEYEVTDYRSELLPDEYPYLKIYIVYKIHFAPLFIGNKYSFGFTISTSTIQKLTWSKLDFKSNNVSTEGLQFIESTGMVRSNSQSIFRISNFYGDETRLKKSIDDLSNPHLEIENCKSFINNSLSIEDSTLPSELTASKIDYPKILVDNSKLTGVRASKLKLPINYFYRGASDERFAEYAMRSKIKFNRPFTYDYFSNRELRIGVIYPEQYQKNIAMFMKAVQEELEEIYKIPTDKIIYKLFGIPDFSLPSYQNILQVVNEIDLAIVVVHERHELLDPENSPYFFCKAKFVERGINSQEVQLQQVDKFIFDKQNGNYNYADHTISLNIYAKLGGTAWTIKPNGINRNELVFGIGSTTDHNGQPVIGMTSVFRGDGKYLYGDLSTVVNIDEYGKTLKSLIQKTIQKSLDNAILRSDKTIYLIFHLFKRAGKYNEIRALLSALEKFDHLDIKYIFAYVGDGHNYRIYNYESTTGEGIGELSVKDKRGTALVLNKYLSFIALRKSNPRYLKIEIDRRSSLIDINYVTQQVYEFSGMSHTSFNKQSLPTTVKYPKLMAKISERLKKVQGFYLSSISMPDDTLWFI